MAKSALERWQHFHLGWVEAYPPDTPIKVGQVVAILARNLGIWWLNACRIVYVVEEEGLVKRFGQEYEEYRRNVPRWIPRLKAWNV